MGSGLCFPDPETAPAPKPAPGRFWRPEEPQFSPATPGPVDAIPADGWFSVDPFNGNDLLAPTAGKEVSLGNDSGGSGVPPDSGAASNGTGGVSLGGDVSVGPGGYIISPPDPNDDPGAGLGASGGGGD